MLRNALILLVVLALLAWPSPAMAANAKLAHIIVTNTRDDLLVYLTIEGAFQEKLKDAILSGVPTTFTFFLTLHRSRGLWFSKEIMDISVTHTVKYDNLKKEFSVSRSYAGNEPVVTPSFDEAKKLMSEIDGLKIVPLNQLEKGKKYQIRAKAQMEKLTLPLYLHYVLFFVSLWDFETDWYTVDFVY